MHTAGHEFENGKCTLQELVYGVNIEKSWKMRQNSLFNLEYGEILKNVENENAHCRTWSMARKLKILDNEKKTVGLEIWRKH